MTATTLSHKDPNNPARTRASSDYADDLTITRPISESPDDLRDNKKAKVVESRQF